MEEKEAQEILEKQEVQDAKEGKEEILENGIDKNKFFRVNLSQDEKIKCLKEIQNKLKKILYVYDKSNEPSSKYSYKAYCGGILIYVSSSNLLFEGELVNIVVNLNAIINNDFDKPQIKRIVFESKNQIDYLLKKYKEKETEG